MKHSECKLLCVCVWVIYMLVWSSDIRSMANKQHFEAIVLEIQTLKTNINLEN